MAKRVVVTGMGTVNPLGLGVQHTWDKLINGESGLSKITAFDTSDFGVHVAGSIPLGTNPGELNIGDFVSKKEQRRNSKFIWYAMVAAEEAMKHSGFMPETQEQKERSGVLFGAGIGGLEEMGDNGIIVDAHKTPRKVSPFFVPSALINLSSGHLSIRYGLQGPNSAVVTACSSGTHAIGDAARIIAADDADMMLVGSSEATVCRLGMIGFNNMKALSVNFNDNPTQASRPWDKDRDGFVMGEGAGALILESEEHAKARGATIYAEVVGYGMSGDAFHITAPSETGHGAYLAMRMALKNAGISPEKIDYINAHGTSTPKGDVIELTAIRKLFNDHVKNLAVSSTKSATGHLLGGAGSVEAVFSIMAMNTGIIPPTLNLVNPDEQASDFNLVPLVAQERNMDYVLSNSFGFGGTNASVVLRKYK